MSERPWILEIIYFAQIHKLLSPEKYKDGEDESETGQVAQIINHCLSAVAWNLKCQIPALEIDLLSFVHQHPNSFVYHDR